jgi:hypothetical protein
MNRNQQSHEPSKISQKVYKYMAAGRHAAAWLPEFLRLYDLVVSEQGEDAASVWVQQELLYSLKPSVEARILRIVRFGYGAWKIYRWVRGNY